MLAKGDTGFYIEVKSTLALVFERVDMIHYVLVENR